MSFYTGTQTEVIFANGFAYPAANASSAAAQLLTAGASGKYQYPVFPGLFFQTGRSNQIVSVDFSLNLSGQGSATTATIIAGVNQSPNTASGGNTILSYPAFTCTSFSSALVQGRFYVSCFGEGQGTSSVSTNLWTSGTLAYQNAAPASLLLAGPTNTTNIAGEVNEWLYLTVTFSTSSVSNSATLQQLIVRGENLPANRAVFCYAELMAEKCSQPGCDRSRHCKSYCPAHYERAKRGATEEEMAAPIASRIRPKCSRPDCNRPHFAKGYCRPHLDRFKKGATEEEMAAPIAERNFTRVVTCGHPDRRYYGNGMCHPCYVKNWIKEHPDSNSGPTWFKRNPERAKYLNRRAVLKKYGITPEEYEAMWRQQEGKCANPGCDVRHPLGITDYRQALHVDHCHATGEIRALLCPGCNGALGHAGESTGRLAGLIEYIRQFTL